MDREEPTMLGLAAGILGALALGAALTPLRTVTPASNLAFVFLVFTIVVAEFGGRTAALVTALVSAMSLNFFLTEPYLTLSIAKTDDVVAFVALALCGLIVAAFGRRRVRSTWAASRARQDLDTLQGLVRQLETGEPLDDVLGDVRRTFRLGRLVLRDADERVIAAWPPGGEPPPIPETELQPDTLLALDETEQRLGARGFRLPEGGARLRPRAAPGISLDLWEGDREGLSLGEWQALSVAASILGLELARRRA